MAALIEGQQYGLSAQDKINSNKTIIFVKLTDSALRSIEEYVKHKGSADSKATIQFQNSNGVLSLPQNGINQTYGFSLSNVEADGPQGSFECLRQVGHRSLESLGCMHMKMHIHANEDSYENTRVKMAAVEKEKNKNCTKVIKVAGAHLGRKVKVKRPGLVVNPPKPLNSPPSASMINKNPLKMTNGVTNGIANNLPPKKLPEVNKYQKPVPAKNKPNSNPELLRQPIRDRIIHILAVRPYKRPELILRLITEGIREKDKKGITAILTQVGVLKGNVYNLANYCWNEVQDNWKFASPEELEIIRKRKQQSLSANIANESPPLNTCSSSSPTPAQKRVVADSFPVGGQEPRVKKQRISHYNRTDNYNPNVKPESSDSNDKLNFTTSNVTRKPAYSPNMNGTDQEGESSPKTSHYSRIDNYSPNTKQESSDSNDKLHQTTTSTTKKSDFSPNMNGIDQELESSPASPSNSCDGFSKKPKLTHYNHIDNSNEKLPLTATSVTRKPAYSPSINGTDQEGESSPKSPSNSCDSFSKKSRLSHYSCTDDFNHSSNNKKDFYYKSDKKRKKVNSTTNGSCSTSPHSPESYSDSNESIGNSSPGITHLNLPPSTPDSFTDVPDYVSKYVRIRNPEQRSKYKQDFNAQYDEYLSLHSKIEKIKAKFTYLNHALRNYDEGSEEFLKISSKIVKAYRAYQSDENYKKSEEKLLYLHNKLSHIKKLVMEYDNEYFAKS